MNDILVVDDELEMRLAINEALSRKGYSVESAGSGKEALSKFGDGAYKMVISDMQMGRVGGMELLKKIKSISPSTPVLLITAFGTVEKAVEAVKEGAVDFILKPFTLESLEITVEKALKSLQDKSSYESFTSKGRGMVARSPEMERVLAMAAAGAPSDATVLISGESGTGKELLARFIHARSTREEGPFVAVNCASIPEGLLESELFGHEKGAFTGAQNHHEGKFEQANGGTLLLDEISEMDLKLQAKLLRVIQEKEVERIGSKTTIPLDVRIIATTNRDMALETGEGRFREDLFYRLNIFPLALPPLRERRDDIVNLAEYFMKKFSDKYSKGLKGITPRGLDLLYKGEWKGNIRELENTIERGVILSSTGELTEENLLIGIDSSCESGAGANLGDEGLEGKGPAGGGDVSNIRSLSEMERQLILKTLDDFGGNRTKTAEALGITVRTLRNKLKEYKENLGDGEKKIA